MAKIIVMLLCCLLAAPNVFAAVKKTHKHKTVSVQHHTVKKNTHAVKKSKKVKKNQRSHGKKTTKKQVKKTKVIHVKKPAKAAKQERNVKIVSHPVVTFTRNEKPNPPVYAASGNRDFVITENSVYTI